MVLLIVSGTSAQQQEEIQEVVLQEQGLGLTGAITSQSAAQVGQLLGVDLAVFGAITAFGDKGRHRNASFWKDRALPEETLSRSDNIIRCTRSTVALPADKNLPDV